MVNYKIAAEKLFQCLRAGNVINVVPHLNAAADRVILKLDAASNSIKAERHGKRFGTVELFEDRLSVTQRYEPTDDDWLDININSLLRTVYRSHTEMAGEVSDNEYTLSLNNENMVVLTKPIRDIYTEVGYLLNTHFRNHRFNMDTCFVVEMGDLTFYFTAQQHMPGTLQLTIDYQSRRVHLVFAIDPVSKDLVVIRHEPTNSEVDEFVKALQALN